MINNTSHSNILTPSCTKSDEGTIENIRTIKKALSTVLPTIRAKRNSYTENLYNAVSLEERTKQNSCLGPQIRIADSCLSLYMKLKKQASEIEVDKSIDLPTANEIVNDEKLIWSKNIPKAVIDLYNKTNELLKKYEEMSHESLMDIQLISVKDDQSKSNESKDYPQSLAIWRLQGELNGIRAPYFDIIMNPRVLSPLLGKSISDMTVKCLNNHLDVLFKAFCHYNIDEFAITKCTMYLSDLKGDALKESVQYRQQIQSNKSTCYSSIMTILMHTHRKLAESKKASPAEEIEGLRIFNIIKSDINKSALAMNLLNEHEEQFKKLDSDKTNETDIAFYKNIDFNGFNHCGIAMIISGILLGDNEVLEAAIKLNKLNFKCITSEECTLLGSISHALDLINNSLQFEISIFKDCEFYNFDEGAEMEKIEKLNLYIEICDLLNFQIMDFYKTEIYQLISSRIEKTQMALNDAKFKIEQSIKEIKTRKKNKKKKHKTKKNTQKKESDITKTNESHNQQKIHEPEHAGINIESNIKDANDIAHPSVDYERQLLDPVVCNVIRTFHNRNNTNINSITKQAEETTKIERLTDKDKAAIDFAVIETVANTLDNFISEATKIKLNLSIYEGLLLSTNNQHDTELKRSNMQFKSDASHLNHIISNLKTNIDYIERAPSYKELLTALEPSEVEKKLITQSCIKMYARVNSIKIIFEAAVEMDRVYKMRGEHIIKHNPQNRKPNVSWENNVIHTNILKIKKFIDDFGHDMYHTAFTKFKTT